MSAAGRDHRRQRGRWAEDFACRFLESRGLTTVTRNYHCRRGELDLIMRERETLVFVEVRFRGRADFGSGAESVDARKRAKIVAAAEHYLAAHPGTAEGPCRFDVVGVSQGAQRPIAEWIRDAFAA